MRTTGPIVARFVLLLSLAGASLFQFGGCGLGDAIQFVTGYNPCGTILACDPVTYEFIRSGYDGPGADPEVDPSCTYPPFCDNDPFVRTIEPGA